MHAEEATSLLVCDDLHVFLNGMAASAFGNQKSCKDQMMRKTRLLWPYKDGMTETSVDDKPERVSVRPEHDLWLYLQA